MIGKLEMVVLDAPDIARLSAFYRGLAGWVESYAGDDWITLDAPDGWQVGLQSVPGHQPPQWPGQVRPQQAHLDLRVPDLEAGLDRALELGGILLSKNETWYTVADPAAMIGSDGEQPVMFQQVADYTAPQWPDPAHPQQYHLDVLVDDLHAAEQAVLALGATRMEGGGKTFRFYADPANKPFCRTRPGES